MKIVADDKIPFLKGALEPYAEVVYIPGKKINKEVLKDSDALLIRTRTKCTKDLLEGTSIKFIGTATIGFDHIDTEYCGKNNIRFRQNFLKTMKILIPLQSSPGRIVQENIHPNNSCEFFNL